MKKQHDDIKPDSIERSRDEHGTHKIQNKPTDTRAHDQPTDSTVPPGAPFDPPPQDVATRAYTHFAERGFVHGCDVDDWLEAERELRSGPKDAATKPSR